jgi:hypothetical protein
VREHLEIASHLAAEGACFTSATFRDVRHIKFSSGAQNRSRPSTSLSGLFLQYENPVQDRYIGQWLEEVDSLDIEAGDYIVRIRVWYTKGPNRPTPERYRWVRGVEILTFKSLRKRVLCGGIHSALDFPYYANPFEQLVSPGLPSSLAYI